MRNLLLKYVYGWRDGAIKSINFTGFVPGHPHVSARRCIHGVSFLWQERQCDVK